MSTWKSKDTDEIITGTFDFTDALEGETIQTATVSISDKTQPVDPSVGSMLVGSPQVVSGKVLIGVRNGLLFHDYKLRCKVTTNTRTLVLAGILPIRQAV